jgi:hypothetical protein
MGFMQFVVVLLVSLVIAIVGEAAILQVLSTSGMTGIMWLIFASILPGSLVTAWIFAALKASG